MTDSMTGPRPPQGPRETAEALIQRNSEILRSAVSVVNPENPSQNPLEIFPKAGEVRYLGEIIELSQGQENLIRTLVSKLGPGRKTDQTTEMIGIEPGYTALIDGGLAWKVMAELEVSKDAGTLIMAGSPFVKTLPNERDFLAAKGIESIGETEYEKVRAIAAALPGFIVHPDIDLQFGYDIHDGQKLIQGSTGQFVKIGDIVSDEGTRKPVILMRIDRENYKDSNEPDEKKQNKYRKQPDVRDRMRIVANMLSARGDEETPVVQVDSSTYQPSRDVDAVRLGLILTGRKFGVVTFGMDTLGRIKGMPSEPPVLANVVGELHRTAEQMTKLRTELGIN